MTDRVQSSPKPRSQRELAKVCAMNDERSMNSHGKPKYPMKGAQTAPEIGAQSAKSETIPFFVPKYYHVTVRSNSSSVGGKKKEDIKTIHFSRAARIFLTLEQPGMSRFGKVVSFVMLVMILVSCTCYIIQTMPSMKYTPIESSDDCVLVEGYICSDYEANGVTDCDDDLVSSGETCIPVPLSFFKVIEMVIIVAFTIDYLMRIATVQFVSDLDAGLTSEKPDPNGLVRMASQSEHKLKSKFWTARLWKTLRYARTAFNLIDLIAILPFWFDLLQIFDVSGAAVIRVLRLARVFRVFRVGKFNEGLDLFAKTLRASSPALTILSFFYAIGCILFGSVMYFFEKGEFMITPEYPNGAYMVEDSYSQTGGEARFIPTNFLSIPYCFYWTIVTATTVGYGDMYPHSTAGKIIAVLCMTGGIITLALPITVIGSNFSREYDELLGRDSEDDDWDDECDADDCETSVESVAEGEMNHPVNTMIEERPENPKEQIVSTPARKRMMFLRDIAETVVQRIQVDKNSSLPHRRPKAGTGRRRSRPKIEEVNDVSLTVTEDLKAIRSSIATLTKAVTVMEGQIRVLSQQPDKSNCFALGHQQDKSNRSTISVPGSECEDEFTMASSRRGSNIEQIEEYKYYGSSAPREAYLGGSVRRVSRGEQSANHGLSGDLELLEAHSPKGTRLTSEAQNEDDDVVRQYTTPAAVVNATQEAARGGGVSPNHALSESPPLELVPVGLEDDGENNPLLNQAKAHTGGNGGGRTNIYNDDIRWERKNLSPREASQQLWPRIASNAHNSETSAFHDRRNHQTLCVTVMEASGIPRVEGVVDSCVVTLSCEDQKRMTQMVNLNNLKWNESVYFQASPPMYGKASEQHIEAQVYCGSIGVGSCKVPLENVDGRDHEYVLDCGGYHTGHTKASSSSRRLRLMLSWKS